MPAHHQIEEAVDEYLSKVIIENGQPLFQSVNKAGPALSGRALNRYNAWAAIRKRARNAGFLTPVGCHTLSQPAAFLANVFGYVNLGNLLGIVFLRSVYIAVVLYTAIRIIEGLITIALQIRPLGSLRVISLHRPTL